MNRRTVIKNLALVAGGAILLPSCLRKDGTSYIQLKHIDIESADQELIADIAETIIPKTGTPGAKDLHLPAFILKMVDDCYDKKGQQSFLTGLAEFKAMVEKKYGRSFGELDAKTRETVLLGIENAAKASPKAGKTPTRRMKPQRKTDADPLNAFYWMTKQQTVFGYTTSQFFMTKEVFYDMVPGRYIVHYPVKKLKTA